LLYHYARKIPFLYDIQDNFELRHRFPALVSWAIRKTDNWIISQSASTIVVGEERIVGDMAQSRDKIAVIPNCPPDVPPPEEIVKDKAHLTLAFVGRIAESRGVRLLLEACRRLPWLRVLMAGEVEGKELGQALSDCSQIELHGYMPQEKALELVHRSDASFAFYDPSTEICRRANGAKWYDAMMAGKCLLVNSEVMNAEISKSSFALLAISMSIARRWRRREHALEDCTRLSSTVVRWISAFLR
jgi:hypothetical protein